LTSLENDTLLKNNELIVEKLASPVLGIDKKEACTFKFCINVIQKVDETLKEALTVALDNIMCGNAVFE